MPDTAVAFKRKPDVRSVQRLYSYRVVIERDEDGRYVIECPTLEGCYTEGRTVEEAIELIQDAIKSSIESRLALGEEVPQDKDNLFTMVTVRV